VVRLGFPFGAADSESRYTFSEILWHFIVAVPFVPPGDYTLDSIRIPIRIFTGAPPNRFTVELRDNETVPVGVVPGAVLERYSLTLSGFSVVDIKPSRHPLLTAGKQYLGCRFDGWRRRVGMGRHGAPVWESVPD